jgi:hypothetical protein
MAVVGRSCGECVAKSCPVKEELLCTAEQRKALSAEALRATGCPVIRDLEQKLGANYEELVMQAVIDAVDDGTPLKYNKAAGLVDIDPDHHLTEPEHTEAMARFGLHLLARHKSAYASIESAEERSASAVENLRKAS